MGRRPRAGGAGPAAQIQGLIIRPERFEIAVLGLKQYLPDKFAPPAAECLFRRRRPDGL